MLIIYLNADSTFQNNQHNCLKMILYTINHSFTDVFLNFISRVNFALIGSTNVVWFKAPKAHTNIQLLIPLQK